MIRAIDRKLLRDIWRLKGQALAIALVIATGVAMYVSQLATLDSLRLTLDDYYERYRFGDVFAGCKRAPLSLAERVADIEGVDRVQTRVAWPVMLDMPDLAEPATARLLSYPDIGVPELNDLYLREGVLPRKAGEIAVSEAFAQAHELREGDRIVAIINGRRQTLTVTGVALSPEYIYSLPPGDFIPDDLRFGVFWMNERELAAATDMEGAFNDISLSLLPGASKPEVLRQLDELLTPYGGLGAIPRAEQNSHWYIENELTQLEGFGSVLPLIFLAVAAFLLNIVMARLISTQREQIAALKAFGYSSAAVALHYFKLVLLVVLVGAAIGVAVGGWLGQGLTELYAEYYHFPILSFRMDPLLPVTAVLITAAAAALGAFSSVRRAAALPPAEAMRPEAPPTYRATLLERIGLDRLLSQPTRMIVRELERRPFKAGASALGIAMACALLVVGYGFIDVFEYVMDVQENVTQREDATVTFIEPRPRQALHDMRGLDGVLYAEPFRAVPARLRFEHRSRLAAVQGSPADARLNRVIGEDLQPIRLPAEGVALSRMLAEVLGVREGDQLTLEVLEGARPTREVTVTALVDDFVGLSAYMEIEALNRLMREDGLVSGVHLLIDDNRADQVYRQLKDTPGVAGVTVKEAAIQNMREIMAENTLMMVGFMVFFSCIIAFGVVYNAARISLSERSRELASLRVLGLTRGEISYILLGELAIITLAAIPLGFVIGIGMTRGMLSTLNTEVIRIPYYLSPFSFSFAATVVFGAAALSALVVRHRLDHLDLVEVLKTRE